MELNRIKRVAVLGGGVMGHGIAQISAVAGFDVVIRDISQDLLNKAKENIEKSLKRLTERGRLTSDAAQAAMGRIRTTIDLAGAVRDADLVVEAIPENLELKRKVWREVSKEAKGDALLATNTSSMSITAIAESVTHPERFAGMHFFNPPVVMRLVEVIPGARTSPTTVEMIKSIAEKMGKTPIAARKDSPGFIVNRILITYINEAAKLLDSGDRTKEQIDSAMQYKAKMPMGPFMLADLIGLDVVYNILRVFYENLGSNYKPAASIERLFTENKLGRKAGEGFYGYKEQFTLSEDSGIGFDVNFLLRLIISEAEKVVEEGISDRDSVDAAMKLGANLPKGPFELGQSL